MKQFFCFTLLAFVMIQALAGCKVEVDDKKQQSPASPLPSALSSWDGRSDRTDASWTLQSLR